jgi:hypothetical protein
VVVKSEEAWGSDQRKFTFRLISQDADAAVQTKALEMLKEEARTPSLNPLNAVGTESDSSAQHLCPDHTCMGFRH